MFETIKELMLYKNLIISLTQSQVRKRYKGSVLGVLWSLINPLFLLVVYGFVFSFLMRGRIENYFLFLFNGLLPWIFFKTSVVMSSNSIVGNAGLIKKTYFPREILPIATVFENLVNFFMGLLILIPALLIFGDGINLMIFWLPVVILVQVVLNLGLALFFSAVTVYLRDMRHILEVLTMAMFYYTPILYTMDMIPERYQPFFKLNPMAPLIDAYRQVLFKKDIPDLGSLLWTFIFSLLILVSGMKVFKHLNRGFAEKV